MLEAAPPSDKSRGDPAQHAGSVESAPRSAGAIAALVLAVGLLITGIMTWTSATFNNRNESHLLKLQTEQAGQVLLATVPDMETPMASALEIASAADGAERDFSRFISTYVGPHREFTSASLWEQTGSGVRLIGTVAAAPDFATRAEASISVERVFRKPGFIVDKIFRGRRERLTLAVALPASKGSRFAVYAEHSIPADRRAAVARNSAFSDLYYAIYLGPSENPDDLLATSFSRLPPSGPSAKATVPFGNTVLTLVTAPSGELGGTLPALLPWILAALGLLLSAAAAWTTEGLVRRRRSAERDATEIRRLYDELGGLFREQRTIAETLQRALLPKETPHIEGMEIAVEYVPGAKGMEIGGDWYSVIPVDDDRFAFVVGDVSGRGLSAATVMAALRFTIRTYALEGYWPTAILDKCSKQLHVLSDGHFATVLVGVGDLRRREITVANAGHLNPLVIDGESTSFIACRVGVPLGVPGGTYESVTVTMPP